MHTPFLALNYMVSGAMPRYERGQRAAFGGALVQRHVALPQDLANKAGKGLLVRALRPAMHCPGKGWAPESNRESATADALAGWHAGTEGRPGQCADSGADDHGCQLRAVMTCGAAM